MRERLSAVGARALDDARVEVFVKEGVSFVTQLAAQGSYDAMLVTAGGDSVCFLTVSHHVATMFLHNGRTWRPPAAGWLDGSEPRLRGAAHLHCWCFLLTVVPRFPVSERRGIVIAFADTI